MINELILKEVYMSLLPFEAFTFTLKINVDMDYLATLHFLVANGENDRGKIHKL